VYRKLGAQHHLPEVSPLRWMDDTLRFHAFIGERKPRTAPIVGGGYIRMEMSEALTRRGIAVTVVEAMPSVLTTVDPAMGARAGGELIRHGVEVVTGTLIEGIEAEDAGLRVHGNNGFSRQADLVLVAIGTRPETALGVDAGVAAGIKASTGTTRSTTRAPIGC
jgi:pyruvate/2-oxoglutarate dehydrogenase complex dihydrolipoamide dehydrogenase (E3) component